MEYDDSDTGSLTMEPEDNDENEWVREDCHEDGTAPPGDTTTGQLGQSANTTTGNLDPPNDAQPGPAIADTTGQQGQASNTAKP